MKTLLKPLLALAAMTLLLATPTAAQTDSRRQMTREQLAETQAKYIARELAFDDATAERFVETYQQCQREIWSLGPARRKSRNHDGANTEGETGQALKDRFAQSQKLLDIREKYYAEYSKFLTQRQIERVYQLERQMMSRLARRGRRQ